MTHWGNAGQIGSQSAQWGRRFGSPLGNSGAIGRRLALVLADAANADSGEDDGDHGDAGYLYRLRNCVFLRQVVYRVSLLPLLIRKKI